MRLDGIILEHIHGLYIAVHSILVADLRQGLVVGASRIHEHTHIVPQDQHEHSHSRVERVAVAA